MPLKGDSGPSVLRNSHVKPVSFLKVTLVHASVACSKTKVELDAHADTCVVGDTVEAFMTIIDQLMTTVMMQKMTTEVPKQGM